MAPDPSDEGPTTAPPGPPPAYGAGPGGAGGARADRPAPGVPVANPVGSVPVYGPVRRPGQPAAGPGAPSGPVPSASTAYPAAPPAAWPPPTTHVAPPSPPTSGSWSPSPPVAPPWAGLPPQQAYASWWRRVASWAIDNLPWWIAAVVLTIGYVPLYAGLLRGDFQAQPHYWIALVGTLLYVAALGWDIYNRWFLAGRTGQSIGKRVTRTWLVSQDTGRPVGALAAFVRDLLHVLDRLGYVGCFWPLWDDQRQTLADKVIRTVVVRTPVAPLAPGEPRHLVV